MAQLVIAAAGAAIGGAIAPGVVALGMTGSSIGWMAGSMIGAAFGPTQKGEGPRLNDLQVGTSSYGTPIPYVAGSPRIAGQIVWASDKREIATTESAGKGGGGSEYTSYTYEVDLLILLTDNPIDGVTRIWQNGELIWTAMADQLESALASAANGKWSRLTVYTGASNQLPDPDYEAAVGTANAPAYRGRGSVFIKSLQLGGSGQIPNLTFEVCTSLTSTPWFGDFLFRRNANNTAWINAANNTSVTAINCEVNGGVGPQLTIDVESVNTLDGIKTAKLNSTAALSRSMLCGSNAGACFAPSVSIPYTGTVTVETFVYLSSADTQRGGFVFNSGGIGNGYVSETEPPSVGAQGTFSAYLTSSGRLYFYTGQGQVYADPLKLVLVSNAQVPLDAWAHLAWVRVGVTWSMYINGTWVAGGDELQTPSAGSNFYVGSVWSQVIPYTVTSAFVGYIAEFRICLNRAVYTNDFQVPSVPLGADVYTIGAVTLEGAASNLCLRTGLAAGQFNTSGLSAITRPVRAMAISQVSSARTVLEMLAQCYHFDAVLSDKIYFKPRGGASVATLTFDEFGVGVDGSSDDPLPLVQSNELEIPAQMALTYNNVDGDYQTDTQYSDRLLTGQESTSAITVPLGFTSSEAKKIVDAALLDKAVSALGTTVSVSIARADIEPTDVIVLTGDDASTYRMRVVKRTEAAGAIRLECVLDDSTVFTQAGTTAGGTASQTTVLYAPTTALELLDVPLLRDVDNTPGHYVAAKGSAANWSRCALYESSDDLTYTQNIVISGGAVMGACTTTLGAWSGGNFADESSVLTVDVGAGQLTSVTHDEMLSSSSVNAAAVGDEIIQFREATLISAGVYELRGLLRGKRGTEWATATHSSADRFVLLSGAGMRFMPRQTSDVGKLIYYKAAAPGQKLSAVAAESLTLKANVLKPFSPINIRYAARADGGIEITWDRRTRLSENWLLGVLPLGEATEAYEIDIYISGVFKRKLFSTAPTVTYSYSRFYVDAGYSGDAFSLVSAKVFQVSALVGLGAGVAATTPDGTSTTDDSGITSTTLYKRPGIGFVSGNNALVFEVVKRIEAGKFDNSAVYKVFESTDGGSNFTQRATLNAPVALANSHWTHRASDGVYITMPIEKRDATQNPSVAITLGVFGSDPVVTSSVWTRPFLPVVMGCNGTTFLIITEGNKSFTSTDGVNWTDNGFISGLPFSLSTSVDASGQFFANVYSPGLVYLSGRWYFYAASMGLFSTSDSIGLTGWTRGENFPTLPNAPSGLPQYYVLTLADTNKITFNSGALFAVGQRIIPTGFNGNYQTNQCVFKSTDNAATWTVSLETSTDAPVFGSISVKAGVLFVYPESFGTWFYYSSDNGTTWTQGASNLTNVGRAGAYPGTSKLLVADYNLGATAPEIVPALFKASSDGFTFTLSNGTS